MVGGEATGGTYQNGATLVENNVKRQPRGSREELKHRTPTATTSGMREAGATTTAAFLNLRRNRRKRPMSAERAMGWRCGKSRRITRWHVTSKKKDITMSSTVNMHEEMVTIHHASRDGAWKAKVMATGRVYRARAGNEGRCDGPHVEGRPRTTGSEPKFFFDGGRGRIGELIRSFRGVGGQQGSPSNRKRFRSQHREDDQDDPLQHERRATPRRHQELRGEAQGQVR